MQVWKVEAKQWYNSTEKIQMVCSCLSMLSILISLILGLWWWKQTWKTPICLGGLISSQHVLSTKSCFLTDDKREAIFKKSKRILDPTIKYQNLSPSPPLPHPPQPLFTLSTPVLPIQKNGKEAPIWGVVIICQNEQFILSYCCKQL